MCNNCSKSCSQDFSHPGNNLMIQSWHKFWRPLHPFRRSLKSWLKSFTNFRRIVWSQRVSIFVPAFNITNCQCILIVFLPSPEFVMTKEKTICLMKRIKRFNIKIRSPDMSQSRQINLSHSLLYQPKFGNVFRNSILLSLFLYCSQSFPITFLPIIDSL